MIYGNYCSSCHGDELRNTSGRMTFDPRRLRAEDHDRFVSAMLPFWQRATKPCFFCPPHPNGFRISGLRGIFTNLNI